MDTYPGIRYAVIETHLNPNKPMHRLKRHGVFEDKGEAERHAQSLGLEPGKYFVSETFSAPGVGKYFSGRS